MPKTVTRHPRAGNTPPRTVETPCGMLNAIGLDNDGIEHFLHHHLPYLRTLPTAVLANIAGENEDDFVDMAAMLGREQGLAGVELNLSCPNVAGGIDLLDRNQNECLNPSDQVVDDGRNFGSIVTRWLRGGIE